MSDEASEPDTLSDQSGQTFSVEMASATLRPLPTPSSPALNRLRYGGDLLRNVFDNTALGMVAIDFTGRYIEANAAMCHLVGYSREQLLSMSDADIIHPDDIPLILAWGRRVCAGDPTNFQVERRLIHRSGYVVWVLMAVSVVVDSNGKPLLAIGQVIDPAIGYERSSERCPEPPYVQRDILVREVHHRIKNNLQSVAGLLWRQISANPTAKDALTAAITQVEAIAIVHGLQSETRQEYLRLCDILAQIATTANNLTNTLWVELYNQLGKPLHIASDETVPLALIFNELVSNAVKHYAPSVVDGVVKVVLQRIDSGGALVTITNLSAGLPADFDFSKGSGVGVGLKLVRSLLPARGVHIDFRVEDNAVVAEVRLSAPVVHQSRN